VEMYLGRIGKRRLSAIGVPEIVGNPHNF